MSKSVLISVNPEWCELIASGEKTVEVRKTKPKLETPFKVYIYCTSPRKSGDIFLVAGKTIQGNGKVIGEFVCDKAERIMADGTCHPQYGYGGTRYNFGHLEDAQLSEQELYDYLGEPVVLIDSPCYTKTEFNGYAWHISDLKIYDKPRELSEFKSYDCSTYIENGYPMPTHEITRPFQSWGYIYETDT